MTYPTQEDATKSLKLRHYSHIGGNVWGRGENRAYVHSYRDDTRLPREGQIITGVRRAWTIAYWPVGETRKTINEGMRGQ